MIISSQCIYIIFSRSYRYCSIIRYPPSFSSITDATRWNLLIDIKILVINNDSFAKKRRHDRSETIGPRRTFVKIEACTTRRLRGCRTGRLRKKYGVNKFCLICRHKSVHQPLRLDEACKSRCWESTCMHDSPRIYTHGRGRSWAFRGLTDSARRLCVIKFSPCNNAPRRGSRLAMDSCQCWIGRL